MAEGTKLIYTFKNDEGKTVQYSFSNAKQSAGLSNLKAVATAMITNTAVLAHTLVSLEGIKEQTTTEVIYNIETASNSPVINGNPDIPETSDSETMTTTNYPY